MGTTTSSSPSSSTTPPLPITAHPNTGEEIISTTGKTLRSFLKSNIFFSDIVDTDTMNKAIQAFNIVRVFIGDGETKNLVHVGDIGHSLYIVAFGKVEVSNILTSEVTNTNEKGITTTTTMTRRIVLKTLKEQDAFAELGFLTEAPSTVNLDVIGNEEGQVVLLQLPKSRYEHYKHAKFMRNLTDWLNASTNHMETIGKIPARKSQNRIAARFHHMLQGVKKWATVESYGVTLIHVNADREHSSSVSSTNSIPYGEVINNQNGTI
jgi:hypothetical protein